MEVLKFIKNPTQSCHSLASSGLKDESHVYRARKSFWRINLVTIETGARNPSKFVAVARRTSRRIASAAHTSGCFKQWSAKSSEIPFESKVLSVGRPSKSTSRDATSLPGNDDRTTGRTPLAQLKSAFIRSSRKRCSTVDCFDFHPKRKTWPNCPRKTGSISWTKNWTSSSLASSAAWRKTYVQMVWKQTETNMWTFMWHTFFTRWTLDKYER
jgi:hypothetical protein